MPRLAPTRRPPPSSRLLPSALPPTAIWATLDAAAQTATLAQISRMVRALVSPAPVSPAPVSPAPVSPAPVVPSPALSPPPRTPLLGEEVARDAGVAEDP